MNNFLATYCSAVNRISSAVVASRATNTPPPYKYSNNQVVNNIIVDYNWHYCFS